MRRVLQGLRDLVLLITRVALGLAMIMHGWHRWQETGLPVQVEHLRRHGVPYPDLAALGFTVMEILGGVFLVVGALTPLVALAFAAEQVLVIAWTKWFLGPSLAGPYGGWEYNAITACLCLLLVVYGAGRVSVDALFRRPARSEDYDEYGPA